MTPKEKASDLVSDFYQIQSTEYDYGINWEMAKQCALIAVNEIINECGEKCMFDKADYFFKVKEEIKDL